MSHNPPFPSAPLAPMFARSVCWVALISVLSAGCYGGEDAVETSPFPSANPTASGEDSSQTDGASQDPQSPGNAGTSTETPGSDGTAPNEPGSSGPDGADPAPEAPKAAYDVLFQVDCENAVPGNLVIALYDIYPAVGAPAALGQLQGVEFPVTVTLPQVPEGNYTAEVILDVAPFNPQGKGPEDIWANIPVASPSSAAIVVSLQGPEVETPEEPTEPTEPTTPTADCGDCAPGLECGADPSFEDNLCSGAAGECGTVDSNGSCLPGDVLIYCSSDDGSGSPVSIDCKLVGQTPHVCAQTEEGLVGCIIPVEETEETETPEETEVPEKTEETEETEETETPEEPASDSPCGECAPGTSCGYDPQLPGTYCAGDMGTCGDLDYNGVCLGDVLYYCTSSLPDGMPVSLDCSLNETATVCKESSPGFFDCMEPTLEDLEVPEGTVTFLDVHPVLVASCSGWVCHQYNGFAQEDVNAAYDVVLEKNLAEDILDAILSGSMPAGNFGFPLCSGDPAVDTNEKCLTQEEQDLMEAWVAFENGEVAGVPADPPVIPEVVTFTQVYPVLQKGCNGFVCHDGGFAGPDINEAYDAVVTKNLCEPILEQVQSGAMPVGKGCTGDPVVDSDIPGCLDVTEHQLLLEWVTGSDEACPGPE